MILSPGDKLFAKPWSALTQLEMALDVFRCYFSKIGMFFSIEIVENCLFFRYKSAVQNIRALLIEILLLEVNYLQ